MEKRGVALVTGSGEGIGRAVSEQLLAAGFDVAMADIEAAQPPLVQVRTGESRQARLYRFDLAEIAAHADLLDRVEADLGRITCLVNNAGVSSLVRGDLLDVSKESFDRSVAINLTGTFFLTQAVARRLLQNTRQAGSPPHSIIFITSANAEIVGENRGDYCMTKAGLSMMSKLFASRLAAAGIAVFEIRPGIIATRMTEPASQRYTRFIEEGGVPMGRWGQPEDVATAVATLASGGIPFATGIHLDVGGGLQLHRV